MGNIPKNGKLSAKAFFKGLNEEKADNTKVSKTIPEEKSMPSPEGNRKREEAVKENEFRDWHADYLEKRADETHRDAKMGVGGYPKYPMSYEEAKEMHTKYEPQLRQAAKNSRAKKVITRYPQKNKMSAKEFFKDVE